MSKKFKSITYLNSAFRRLVFEFEEASQAGTPGLIGLARENPARARLQDLLPQFSAVGSGIVIDSYHNTSRQQDVVIYERHFCPIFTLNNSPEATYYPCEGVIAVGEIKSTLGEKELKDAFEKIASVKRLKRFKQESKNLNNEVIIPFRQYGSKQMISGTKKQEFDQENKEMDQIFDFILCKDFGLQKQTILEKAGKLWKQYPAHEAPNYIISLNSGFMQLYNSKAKKGCCSIMTADRIGLVDDSEMGFSLLINSLNLIFRNGRTVDSDVFRHYFLNEKSKDMASKLFYNLDNDEITSQATN